MARCRAEAAEAFIAGPENALVRALAEAAVAEVARLQPARALWSGRRRQDRAWPTRWPRGAASSLALKNVIATTGADLARAWPTPSKPIPSPIFARGISAAICC